DPFRQGDSSSTRLHGGLGLGLALVRELVELHGGHVRAESAGKNGGATFTVMLPLARSAAPTTAAPHDAPAKVRQGPDLDGVSVLVVDDDVEFLEMVAVMLRQAGADVRTASSAYAASEVVKAWKPAVVLTDLAMPVQDGFMLLGTL